MKCIKCGHVMGAAAPRTLNAEVRGERFAVQVVAAQCEHCGRVLLNAKARRMFHRAGSDAYRRQHGLLTMTELDHLRRNLGMTWRQFAGYVGIGIATLKRWIGGEIQSDAYNSLVRLKADLNYVEQAASDLLTRLTENSGFTQQTIEVHASDAVVRHARRRVHHVTGSADSQYALAA